MPQRPPGRRRAQHPGLAPLVVPRAPVRVLVRVPVAPAVFPAKGAVGDPLGSRVRATILMPPARGWAYVVLDRKALVVKAVVVLVAAAGPARAGCPARAEAVGYRGPIRR